MTTRLKPSACPYCYEVNDSASGVSGAEAPTPGDIALCLYCAGVSVYDDAMTLRLPSTEELQEAYRDPMVRLARKAIRERLR